MSDRLVDRADRFHRHAVGEELRPEAVFVGRLQQFRWIVPVQGFPCLAVGKDNDVFAGQRRA